MLYSSNSMHGKCLTLINNLVNTHILSRHCKYICIILRVYVIYNITHISVHWWWIIYISRHNSGKLD